MNIYITRDNDLCNSIKDLDDNTLISQINLVFNILEIIGNKAYIKMLNKASPTIQYYYSNPKLITYWGVLGCIEYKFRFDIEHPLSKKIMLKSELYNIEMGEEPNYIPYFERNEFGNICKGGTSNNATKLIRRKLFWEWTTSAIAPKWTKRNIPTWAKNLKNKIYKNEIINDRERISNC